MAFEKVLHFTIEYWEYVAVLVVVFSIYFRCGLGWHAYKSDGCPKDTDGIYRHYLKCKYCGKSATRESYSSTNY